ncbi:sensor histidine kinase [Calidifontibacter terrae]
MNGFFTRWQTSWGDVALALALLVLAQIDTWFGTQNSGPRWANAVFVTIMATAMAWRCTHPLAATVVLLGVGLLGQAVFLGASDSPTELAMVVVLSYSVASYAARAWPPLVMIVLALAAHDTLDPTIHSLADRTYDLAVCGLAALFGLATKRRAHKLFQTELALRTEQERRAHSANAAAAAERARIARELHDIVSHGLGIVVLQAGAADQMLERDTQQARQALGVIRSTGLEAIEEMSRLLGVLRGETGASRSPQPSLADLPALLDQSRAVGLEVTLQTGGDLRGLPAPIDLSAYRLIQEGLTNARRHARASTGTLRVERTADWLSIALRNPLGPDEGPGGGRGLPGMRERVSIFGGRFSAGPTGTGQWELMVDLPLTQTRARA